jgi:3-hydroxyisobutyryl-CoA hydrolase
MGGGVGISVHSPIIIATEKTVFAMPEAKLGFFTDAGVNYILSRLRNNIGYYLGMTGSRLRGE